MDIYYIYKITNTINNKSYIGFTSKEPEIRFSEHVKVSRFRSDIKKGYLHKAIAKYGAENFTLETLYKSFDRNDCLSMENFYIVEEHSIVSEHGYNLEYGGIANKKASLETKKKQSNSHKKKVLSVEHKQNISKALTGKKHSPEHYTNLCLANKRNTSSRKRIRVNGVVYDYIIGAAKELDIPLYIIGNILRKKDMKKRLRLAAKHGIWEIDYVVESEPPL